VETGIFDGHSAISGNRAAHGSKKTPDWQGACGVAGENSLALGRESSANMRRFMKELPHTKSCFVCGESNASGLRLRFETDGCVVVTRFRAGADHVGFKGTIHGGIIATVLDEIMVWACAVQTQRFAYCAELKVRFASPMRPGQEVLASAELTSNRRNKLFEAKGELRDEAGAVLATATGKYLPIKESEVAEMMTDFKEDANGYNPLARE
jgi:uncharacterized protein (TIGR00369 family)